jgi:hypothetical protein
MTKQYDNFADLITFTRASTGTYLDSDGLLKTATTNTPRIDYDANGNRKGLLIEGARTNLLPDSIPAASVWDVGSATLTANAALSPDGTTTASEFNLSVGGFTFDTATVVASTTYTASWYIKAGTATSWIYAFFNATALSFINRIQYNITDGEDVGNGWYRFSASVTTPVGCTSLRVYPIREQNAVGSVAGATGTSFLWGAQLEAGSFPTSYIPTAGSTATRSSDVASIPTSAFGYNADKGTVVCEFETQFGATGFPRIWEIGSTSTAINRVNLYVSAALSRVNFDVISNNVGATNLFIKADPTPASGKFGTAFADDDFVGVADGGSPVTDISGSFTTPSIPRDALFFGSGNYNSSPMSGHIKSIQYYPRRLTNAQLQRLTA